MRLIVRLAARGSSVLRLATNITQHIRIVCHPGIAAAAAAAFLSASAFATGVIIVNSDKAAKLWRRASSSPSSSSSCVDFLGSAARQRSQKNTTIVEYTRVYYRIGLRRRALRHSMCVFG